MLQSAIVCATVALSSAFIDTASAVRTAVCGATENASPTAKAAHKTPKIFHKNLFYNFYMLASAAFSKYILPMRTAFVAGKSAAFVTVPSGNTGSKFINNIVAANELLAASNALSKRNDTEKVILCQTLFLSLGLVLYPPTTESVLKNA